MKAGRFSESQIVAILKQQDSGQTVAQITREHGVSEATARAAPFLQLEGQVWWYAGSRSQEAERFRRRKSAVKENVRRVEFTARNN